MKKFLAMVLMVCFLCTLPFIVSAEEPADSAKVVFPGSNFSAWNPSGVWLEGEFFYAQAFNVNRPILGFIMTAWAVADTSALSYILCEYHTDMQTSVEEEDFITEGVVPIDVDNPFDWEVLFDEEVPAGKYVLILQCETGRFGLNLVSGKTEETDFLCSEEISLVDNFGMTFDPAAGDDTVMAGGLIFSGSADETAFMSMAAESLAPTKDPNAATKAPATEAPTEVPEATDVPVTETPAADTPAAATEAVDSETNGGCGSILGGSSAILALFAVSAFFMKKKRL